MDSSDQDHIFSQRLLSSIRLFLIGFLVVLFIPLKIRIGEPAVFFGGDFNSYDSFYLYLSDIFLLVSSLLIALYFIGAKKFSFKIASENFKPILFFFSFFVLLSVISVFFSDNRFVSLMQVFRWIEVASVAFFVATECIPTKLFVRIFAIGMICEVGLATMQYLIGSNLGLAFLGEPVLTIGHPNIATVQILGKTFLRGYGTFLHPNVFAAYCLFGVFLALLYKRYFSRFATLLILGLSFGVLISFSRAALVALVFIFAVYFYSRRSQFSLRKFIVPISFVGAVSFLGLGYEIIQRFRFTDVQALQFRGENFLSGLKLIFARPFGVGLGGSSDAMQLVSSAKLSPWEYQPAHNVFVVAVNELGILGLCFIVFCTFWLIKYLSVHRRKQPLVFAIGFSFLLLSSFDHYFFTLYHGQILFAFFLSFLVLSQKESSVDSH